MANRKKQPVYEEQPQASPAPLMKVLGAVACFGAAVLMVYLTVAPPQPGTAMGALRNVMRGLGGSVSLLMALMLVWIGVLLVYAAKGKKIKVLNIIMNLLLFICGFTAVQLFSARTIIEQHMSITTFANFVSKSYQFGAGGGAIGSLIAYPLYIYLGQWGGLIVILLAALLALTATGRAQQFYNWTMRRAEAGQHHMEQRRNQRNVERLFDYNSEDFDEYDQYDSRRSVRRPVQPRPQPQRPAPRRASNPHNDYMILETPAPSPRRSKASAAPAAASGRKKLYKETIDQEAVVEKEESPGMDIPKPLREIRKNHPVIEDIEVPAEKPRRKSGKFPRDIPDFFTVEEENSPETPAESPAQEEEFIPRSYQSRNAKPKRVVEGVQPLTVDGIISEQEPQEEDDDEAPFDIPHAGEKKAPRFSRKTEEASAKPEPREESYPYPPMKLLKQGTVSRGKKAAEEGDLYRASVLISTLKEFNVDAELVAEGIVHGPAVTCFKVRPGKGVPVESITKREKNIMLNLEAASIRIEAPIPGESAVGIEVPNKIRETILLRDILESAEAKNNKSKLSVAIGKDNMGRYILGDIKEMRHLLVAGQTGSGKSVCLNSIILSLLYRATPDEVRMIMIDPKQVELTIYDGIPHLIAPVVCDSEKARAVLDWAVMEMESRYTLLNKMRVRNIEGYNDKLKILDTDEEPMPNLIIIIDEFADMMDSSTASEKREVENNIKRLSAKARAAGIYLIIATQRPSVDVITGVIKNNIPSRIAFTVGSAQDSGTIIGHGGAEKLLGKGDMLYSPQGKPLLRVQGPFVSDEEVEDIVSYITSRCSPTYDEDVVEKIENCIRSDAEKEEAMQQASDYDAALPDAIRFVIEQGQASTSSLQRHFRMGYARAGRVIDQMEQRGIISKADGSKPREVLIGWQEFLEMFPDEE